MRQRLQELEGARGEVFFAMADSAAEKGGHRAWGGGVCCSPLQRCLSAGFLSAGCSRGATTALALVRAHLQKRLGLGPY